jgi:hypothetical protein
MTFAHSTLFLKIIFSKYEYIYILGEILTLLGNFRYFWGILCRNCSGNFNTKIFFLFGLTTLISLHHRIYPKKRTNFGAIGIYSTPLLFYHWILNMKTYKLNKKDMIRDYIHILTIGWPSKSHKTIPLNIRFDSAWIVGKVLLTIFANIMVGPLFHAEIFFFSTATKIIKKDPSIQNNTQRRRYFSCTMNSRIGLIICCGAAAFDTAPALGILGS